MPARENGEWAERKLEFLTRFGPTAIDATNAKLKRVYIDLFAGPGINLDKDRPDREFESGALRVLQMTGHGHPNLSFTDAVLVNVDESDHAALTGRVDRLAERGLLAIPRDRIQLLPGDANTLIPTILGGFHALDYLLVFADPESPSQWPWRSVQALRSLGHQSVDLYSLLPLEMGIRRLLNFKGAERTKYGHILTAFFGCESWHPIIDARVTLSQSMEMSRKLEDLYIGRLKNGLWTFAERALAVRRQEGQGLYRMVFASDHEAGKKIASWAKRKAQEEEQLSLGGDL